jgi:hypothetical protein
VTRTRPVVAVFGIAVLIWVGDEASTVQATLLTETAFPVKTGSKFVPTMESGVPTGPLVGVKLLIVGRDGLGDSVPPVEIYK